MRDIYRGYLQPDILLIVRGGFIVSLFVVIGIILVTFPDRLRSAVDQRTNAG